ncbi:hypothetical protein [Pelagibius sp.]|uniref:hypothetical protein n=1 Tax=Pelagibius sp. TaxID=1931238 RepID=UPI003B50B530
MPEAHEQEDRKTGFTAGANLAMKVPAPLYAETVAFYRDVLALKELKGDAETTAFAFGAMTLHLDCCPQMSQAELWLQVTCEDSRTAAVRLHRSGIRRCDGIEPLPEGFDGFWITNPAGIVHLIDAAGPTRQ